jgi:hypothetical protein
MSKNSKNDYAQYGKVLRRAFITLLSGGLAYFITNMSSQPQIWVLTISVFISGVTLVLQFINDFDNHLESFAKKLTSLVEEQGVHTNEIQSLIENGFARTNEVNELFRAVEESPLRTEAITELVRNSTQIDPSSPPLVNGFAQSRIDRTSKFLKELGDGGVVAHDGEDREWLLELTEQSQHTIDATSLSTVDAGATSFHGGLWTSDFGQLYLGLQREAIDRGVLIRRVFILDSGFGQPGDEDSDFMLIYRQQQDLGIQVRVLDRSAIPRAFKERLFDFVVFDNTISYEVTAASRVDDGADPTIVKTLLRLKPDRIRERRRRFEELWECAQEFNYQPNFPKF